MLVPMATREIAVTESLMPRVHPKWEARSPMKAVSTPIIVMETKKHSQPQICIALYFFFFAHFLTAITCSVLRHVDFHEEYIYCSCN